MYTCTYICVGVCISLRLVRAHYVREQRVQGIFRARALHDCTAATAESHDRSALSLSLRLSLCRAPSLRARAAFYVVVVVIVVVERMAVRPLLP